MDLVAPIAVLLVVATVTLGTEASIHAYDLEPFREVGNALLLSGGSEGIVASRLDALGPLRIGDDLVVASAGDDKKISLWNKNGQSMGSFPSHGSDLADDIEMSGCHSNHCLHFFPLYLSGLHLVFSSTTVNDYSRVTCVSLVYILAPLAYVLERNRRPSFSFGVMLKIFILAMLGITIQQNVYYVGLHLISPTVASALGNVIPAFTFLLAIVLRMEKLNLKTVRPSSASLVP
ncbi:hypothetical protein ZIOFF_066666 [Zingiber officinale]|uniref:WAT1-related protein n=1 Tax=Zingiber officinale TaxID=94328 RepID=A0A8J5F3T4_ZINOF|nr:hypothetical protein ZIOFF_066666 [Zingiber officinale]